MFYTFRQNNSGGRWDEPAITVIVEADSAKEANDVAEANGVYFCGVDEGKDCDCCGDRWWPQTDEVDANPVPTLWGEPINLNEDYPGDKYGINWGKDYGLPNFLVVYKDGSRKIVK